MEKLAERVNQCLDKSDRHAWVGSVSPDGIPHLAISARFEMIDNTTARLWGWCCFSTINNLRKNPRVAIGVCSKSMKEGWQLIGTIGDIGVAEPETAEAAEEDPSTARACYNLTVTIDAAYHLIPGHHSDSAL